MSGVVRKAAEKITPGCLDDIREEKKKKSLAMAT